MQVQIKIGDITHQSDIEAVVNSANANLRLGSGVAGAIHSAAGPQLETYCAPFAPLDFGCALLTPGFNLPNPWVIHVRAAHYINHANPQEILKNAIVAMMNIVRSKRIKSLAIPAIGTGVFKFPVKEAAQITAETLSSEVSDTALELIRFCIPDRVMARLYQSELERFF